MAMVAAGFTGGQAEELRRAMGFKRSLERMNAHRDGAARGHDRRTGSPATAQDEIVPGDQVVRALWFPRDRTRPRSRCSPTRRRYLKAHHPAAFCAALLEQLADGLLSPGDAGHRRRPPRRRAAARSTSRARTGCARSEQTAGARCGSACATSPGLQRGGRRGASGGARARAPFASLADFAQRARRRRRGDDDAWPRSARSTPSAAGRHAARARCGRSTALGQSGDALFGGVVRRERGHRRSPR